MTEQLILQQLHIMPENLRQEVLDFVGYLISKHHASISKKNTPTFGSAKDKYVLADDFDAPLEDFKEYM